MLKLIDLIETVVFVLRKKSTQISFLHLYHHVSTFLLFWLITRYVPVAMASFDFFVNCSVHVIMYTYYFLSAFGENMQEALSVFKPLLTTIQMVSNDRSRTKFLKSDLKKQLQNSSENISILEFLHHFEEGLYIVTKFEIILFVVATDTICGPNDPQRAIFLPIMSGNEDTGLPFNN